ncbi:NTP transferase domain-containing protein [Oscillochloris sp. ZM17-4]|uniref:nucleotidyltransferase family protein n=1 Tax=Oscillochloris sp. ZM17-4 TaxID=2866714 RepID=UPI001C73611D|nr:sugar phosphate nucleotidyltransferase [Oscillochloris sp. ZM17-4]MBX0327759.1 NTP transferase domain-containing protein [Oscillochloris sp. ZM17-4]
MSDLIGLLPAAGRGSRLGPIPCSKEIMPLGFRPTPAAPQPIWRPVTALELHLHALRRAGAGRAVIVIGETKADIVRYVGDGAAYDLPVAYVYQRTLAGMPYALDLATPWVGAATTLFSMPDTLIYPEDTMSRLAAHHRGSGADVTLGVFRTSSPQKFGMVEIGPQDEVRSFVDKPARTTLEWMWGMAAWSPRFTGFMRAHLASRAAGGPECVLSDVFAAALDAGLVIQALPLTEASYHDIGTPEDFQSVVLSMALRHAGPDDYVRLWGPTGSDA